MIELTCISCPKGCSISAEVEDDTIVSLRGNACKRGETYANTELLDPRRTLTTTVAVEGSGALLPVKSAEPLPKDKLFACMDVLRRVHAELPVNAGQVIVKDILGTGIDIVACDEINIDNV
jgi:CxxC motif-containing protein